MTKAASLVGYMQSLRALCCGEAGWVVVQVVSVHIACVAYSRAATTAKAPKPPSALTTSKRLLEAAPVNGSMEAVELGLELLEEESALGALLMGTIVVVAVEASATGVDADVTEARLLRVRGREVEGGVETYVALPVGAAMPPVPTAVAAPPVGWARVEIGNGLEEL